jgi:hypothetical protein
METPTIVKGERFVVCRRGNRSRAEADKAHKSHHLSQPASSDEVEARHCAGVILLDYDAA